MKRRRVRRRPVARCWCMAPAVTRLVHGVYDRVQEVAYSVSLPVCQAHTDPDRWPASVHDRATDEAMGGEPIPMTEAEFRSGVPDGAAERSYGPEVSPPPPVHSRARPVARTG